MRILSECFIRFGNADFIEQFQSAFCGFFLCRITVFDHRFHDLPADRHGRIQRSHRILEDHGDVLAAELVTDLFLRHLGQIEFLQLPVLIETAVFDGTRFDGAVGVQDAHHRLDGDRLAGTRFADDRDRLALEKIQTDAADGADDTEVGLEGDVQVSDGQDTFIFISFEFCHTVTYLFSIFGSKASLSPSANRLKQSIRIPSTTTGMIRI